MTTIVYKNSYETAYYAFKYKTQRAIREFYEGLIYPIATIFATLCILAIEFFFLEKHFIYVAGLLMLFLVILKAFFSRHLQKKFTDIALDRLASDKPMEKFHGIEILAQKGHKNSFQVLANLFSQCVNDDVLEKKVTEALGQHSDARALPLLMNGYLDKNEAMKEIRLKAISKLAEALSRKSEHCVLRRTTADFLAKMLELETSKRLKLDTLRALALYDAEKVMVYTTSSHSLLKAEALSVLWKKGLHRHEIQTRVQEMMKSPTRDNFLVLAYLAAELPKSPLSSLIEAALVSDEDSIKLYAHFALIRLHRYEAISGFLDLLLEGNPVIYAEGIELLETCQSAIKRRIAKSVQHDYLLMMFRKKDAEKSMERLHQIYRICEANDELEFVRNNGFVFSPALSSI